MQEKDRGEGKYNVKWNREKAFLCCAGGEKDRFCDVSDLLLTGIALFRCVVGRLLNCDGERKYFWGFYLLFHPPPIVMSVLGISVGDPCAASVRNSFFANFRPSR